MKLFHPQVVHQFQFEGSFSRAAPIGSGHINDTYLVEFETNGSVNRYILQRINLHVFRDPACLMSNIQAVTNHLSQKINSAGGDPRREALTLIPTTDENCYHQTDEGEYWRGYLFINNARTYERIEYPDHAYHAGAAFGKFLGLLSDYPTSDLVESIPDFHHTPKRYEAFMAAVEKDELNRARSSQDEINFVLQREQHVSVLVDAQLNGELPERITHNDTKFNNVMIDDKTGEGVCVIDLDTVMPGLSPYDYGDAIRSIANSAAEDEQGLSRVKFDPEIFTKYTQGYLDSAGDVLTTQEKDYLAFSVILMTLECGMRFLSDHLQGDKYFKIHRAGHNLDRCRTQFKMVANMEKQFDKIRRTIEQYR
jgi:hypothetical protein